MRYFTLAVLLVIAASIGVMVSVLLVRPSGTTMAVTTQQREDQIVIFLGDQWGIEEEDGDWVFYTPVAAAALDIADYPPNATFRFEVVFYTPNEGNFGCARLVDVAGFALTPVSGSEVCLAGLGRDGYFRRMRSGPLILPPGERNYSYEFRSPSPPGYPKAVRIIVEWDEPLVSAVGGIVQLRNDRGAPSERAASDSSLPLPASVAIGLLVMGAGGLYVVRMRRG